MHTRLPVRNNLNVFYRKQSHNLLIVVEWTVQGSHQIRGKNIYIYIYWINRSVDFTKSTSSLCRQQQALAVLSQAVSTVATVSD